VKEMSW